MQEVFGYPVVTLQLVDPRFYHLDTALTVPTSDLAYLPRHSRPAARRRCGDFPDAVHATMADAEVLGLNAVSDGRHVVLPAQATHLAATLRDRGYQTIGVDLSELRKAGGGPKCCTLRLRQGKANT